MFVSLSFFVFFLFFFWGGGGNMAEQTLGGPEQKSLKIFEIFISEITADASNFKK